MATIVFILLTLLFLDVTGTLHRWFGSLAKIQFLPAVLSLNFIVIAILLIITLIFGRIYCSVICPLGILQDIISWFRSKFGKKAKYSWSKEKKWLRYGLLAIFIIALIAGVQSFVALLAPYSSFGRIAENLFSPIYLWGNNLLAWIAARADSYAFYPKEVWLKSLPTFIIAAVTLIVLIILAWRGGRTYCNTICPVGTTLSFLSRFSAFRPMIDGSKCKVCHKCEKNCKASCISLKDYDVDYSRCVTCFNCISSCKFDAMKYRFAWKPSSEKQEKKSEKQEKKLKKADINDVDMSKRAFIVSSLMVLSSISFGKGQEKLRKGYARISGKKAPERTVSLTPFGSGSAKNFYSHCTACQLCVANCPDKVLRPSGDLARLMQPEMSYERGYCRPECVKCSEVCPAGAIIRINSEEKKHIQIGLAEVEYSLCFAYEKGAKCGLCAKKCPTEAITMVSEEQTEASGNKKKVRMPVVDGDRCIGCGACEFYCPARPISAITVNGREIHIKR